jgi:hypothetical protein
LSVPSPVTVGLLDHSRWELSGSGPGAFSAIASLAFAGRELEIEKWSRERDTASISRFDPEAHRNCDFDIQAGGLAISEGPNSDVVFIREIVDARQ